MSVPLLNIEKLYKVAQKHGLTSIYLFGSYHDGTSVDDSDIDMAYLEINEQKGENVNRGDLYFDFKEFIRPELDLINIQKVKPAFAFQIIKSSQLIYDSDPELRLDFEDGIIMKYLDYRFYENLMNRELGEEYSRN